jgi:hypothetical protein
MGLPRLIAVTIQSLTDNQARTEAISSGIEKKRFSSHGIEAHGTLTAHLLEPAVPLWTTD